MPNLQEHLPDQAERKIYTEIEKGKEAASGMSIGVPMPPTTNHDIDHVFPEADSPKKHILTTPQFGSSHEPEQEAQQVHWRLGELNGSIEPSRDWPWSEEEGDQAFDRGCEEWRKRSLSALELQEKSELNGNDHSGPASPSECPNVGDQQGFSDQNSASGIEAFHIFVPEPEWVQDYNQRQQTTPKTPKQPNFDDNVQMYEPYSPEKLKSPPSMRFAHERDLLDLPYLDYAREKEADDPIGSLRRSVIDRALQSPERLLFLADDDEDIDRTQIHHSENPCASTSATGSFANATTIMRETPIDRAEDGQAPSSDDDGSDFRSFGNMLIVSILRQIVAAAGGLATLPDVLRFDDDDGDADGDDGDEDDGISELELDD